MVFKIMYLSVVILHSHAFTRFGKQGFLLITWIITEGLNTGSANMRFAEGLPIVSNKRLRMASSMGLCGSQLLAAIEGELHHGGSEDLNAYSAGVFASRLPLPSAGACTMPPLWPCLGLETCDVIQGVPHEGRSPLTASTFAATITESPFHRIRVGSSACQSIGTSSFQHQSSSKDKHQSSSKDKSCSRGATPCGQSSVAPAGHFDEHKRKSRHLKGSQLGQDAIQQEMQAGTMLLYEAHNNGTQLDVSEHPVLVRPRVRARRGQATDPHSIAERLRRERISDRMKALQELVPNFNKTDKASMLDEIIEYVKFLQLQVKVLSMTRLGVGAVGPLITDVSPEDGITAAENHVMRLMEEDIGCAMQFLQSKGLCLIPISLVSSFSGACLGPGIGQQQGSAGCDRSDMNALRWASSIGGSGSVLAAARGTPSSVSVVDSF